MRAVRFERFGGVEVLDYGEWAMPDVGTTDVLVRVTLSSVSGWDVKYRRGTLPTLSGRPSWPLPMQPGRDAVGVVERVGAAVTSFAPGDRVVGLVHPADPLSREFARGVGNLSPRARYPGHTAFGGNAEFVSRPQDHWRSIPAGVSDEHAAAALWSYATAHRVVMERAGCRMGDTMLVAGGSGGMGTALLDLARLCGVRVLAVTRHATKLPTLAAYGAAPIMLDDDPARAIAAAAGEAGVASCVDFSGAPDMIRLCLAAVRPGGTLVVAAGEECRNRLPLRAADLVRLELDVRGVRGSTLHDQQAVLDLLASDRIRPRVHAILPLRDVAAAHAALEAGEVSGRILLHP